jgi:hypothetical protein
MVYSGILDISNITTTPPTQQAQWRGNGENRFAYPTSESGRTTAVLSLSLFSSSLAERLDPPSKPNGGPIALLSALASSSSPSCGH